MKTDHSTYLEAKKETVIDKEILSPENYGFYMALFTYIEKYAKRYSGEIHGSVSNTNLPVIKAQDISLADTDTRELKDALVELAGIITTSHGGLTLDTLVEHMTADGAVLETSLRALISSDYESLKDLADKLKIGTEELIFILVNLFKPFLVNLRQSVFKDIDVSQWLNSRCPFCGYYPSIAKIVEVRENQRILHCALCDYEWKFARIGCVSCGNDDHKKLGYFEFEDNPVYRFDYCTSCNGYIKTLRIPKQHEEERYDLAVEDILTNFLDASAINMGYERL